MLDIVHVSESELESGYVVDIHDYAGAYENSVREILDLLGIEAKLDGSAILLPFRTAVGRSASEIHVQARSAYEVLQVFGAGVEIPPAHLEAGIVEPLAWEPPEESGCSGSVPPSSVRATQPSKFASAIGGSTSTPPTR